jgi:hypothetical protein
VLFDLRSRGRRRTVQVIYIFLALLMVGGLLLVGVGTGSGGGILNAFTNNGSGSDANSVVVSTAKKAVTVADENPTNAADWDAVVGDQWAQATHSPDYNGKAFTAAGKRELTALTQSWAHYLTLTKTPDSGTATLVARVDYLLGNYAAESSAWQQFANGNPQVVKGYECLAAAAYAAKETRTYQLAVAQALQLTPKAQRFEAKTRLTAAMMPTLQQECSDV